MGGRGDRRQIADVSRRIAILAFGGGERILERSSGEGVRQTSWLVRSVERWNDVRGHGGFHRWRDGNVSDGRNAAKSIQHFAKSFRKELANGLFDRGKFVLLVSAHATLLATSLRVYVYTHEPRTFHRTIKLEYELLFQPDPNILEAETPQGLIRGHAYSITRVKHVEIQTPNQYGRIPLLRLRNPWGNEAEWNGPWSDQ